MIIWVVMAAILIGADQYTKFIATQRLASGNTIDAIPNLLQFDYNQNDGMAMGLFRSLKDAVGVGTIRWTLVAITFVVMVFVVLYAIKHRKTSNLMMLSLTLIFAGGIGNLIDRTLNGFVVDFIFFPMTIFPFCYNLADIFVSIGGILLVVYVLFFYGTTNGGKIWSKR